MRLIVGRIAKPHGIRGEVLVDVRTDDPEARFAVGSVLSTDPTAVRSPARPAAGGDRPSVRPPVAPGPGAIWRVPETLTIEAARPHLGRYIVLFDGVYDRNLAEELRGVLLCIDSSQVTPPEDPDEFSDFELVGLAAVDEDGERLGEVLRVEHAPSSDLLVISRPNGSTALVPFVRAIVAEVDVAGGRVVLTPPEGLLDL